MGKVATVVNQCDCLSTWQWMKSHGGQQSGCCSMEQGTLLIIIILMAAVAAGAAMRVAAGAATTGGWALTTVNMIGDMRVRIASWWQIRTSYG